MSKPYRLTLYDKKGLIEQVLPFAADDDKAATAYVQREWPGQHALLVNDDRVVEWFPDEAFKELAARRRGRLRQD
jgi:hypothetical protein